MKETTSGCDAIRKRRVKTPALTFDMVAMWRDVCSMKIADEMAGATGPKPAASCVTGRRSNQLTTPSLTKSRLIPPGSQ